MSKVQLLLDVVRDMRSLADSIQAVADAVFSSETQSPAAPKEKPAETTESPAITIEQVRGVLAELSQNGMTADVRALLQKHGADKLSGIDPAKYSLLLADAEVLSHAKK